MAIYVGIEEDTHSVRAAFVRAQLGRAQVQRYAEVWFSQVTVPPAIEGEEPPDVRKLAIAELLRSAGRVEAVCSMPVEELSLRKVELPAVALRKLDELLPFELESLVPFDPEESVIEHQPMEAPDPAKIAVLTCVAPKARVRQRLAELAAVGLDPISLVPSVASLAGLAAFTPSLAAVAEPIIVLNLGIDRTEVAILEKGRTALARVIAVGHRHLEATGYGEPSLHASTEQLARELRQTIASYRMQGGGEPGELHLAGILDPNGRAAAWLGGVLEREPKLVELPDATPSPERGADAAFEAMTRVRFAGALGLVGHALGKRSIELRSGEFVRTRQLGAVRELGPLVAVALVSVFLAWGFSFYARYSVLEARRQVLEEELLRISGTHLGQETSSVTEARELLARGRANPDPMPAWTAFDALLSVSAAIPDTIRHDVQRMQIDLAQDRSEGRFELQGIVDTIEESDRVREALAQITCFQNLEQSGPATPAADGRRQYRLEAEIRCPDDRRGTDQRGSSRRSSTTSASQGSR